MCTQMPCMSCMPSFVSIVILCGFCDQAVSERESHEKRNDPQRARGGKRRVSDLYIGQVIKF